MAAVLLQQLVSTLILIAIFYRVMTRLLRLSLCCNFCLFRLKISYTCCICSIYYLHNYNSKYP